MFIDLRKKGDRERNINAKEKHLSVASHMHPYYGSNPNLGMCPNQGLNSKPFAVQDDAPTN